ncbi:beta strand repeat-containing protein [Marinobacterium arenosum]|uniref:beta strand repeat-containing protein n=1 Tax=Marinobacterium arenosum TaxID=2862496 RepID=UPI001C979945|nr:DUF4214 domain-containing protein [Marinobacterium arenosum]MBY4676817.1 DUF4214 domain-containing protein [Marinobacterium arenosum]
MAASDFIDQVQEVYIAYYGRPADPVGLTFWTEKLDEANGDLAAIIDAFGTSAEANTLFGGQTNEQTVNTLFNQLFGRDADVEGLLFYSNALANGTLTAQSIALDILNGAQNDDATIVANKLAVAKSFTDALDTSAEIIAYSGDDAAQTARDLMATVDASTDTATFDVATTIAAIEAGNGGVEGTTFTLTTGVDNLTGTANNDTFIAQESATIAAGDTLQVGDTIDGAGGTDTMSIVSDTTGTVSGATLKNIENVVVRTTAAEGTGASTFNAANAAQMTNLTLDRITDDFTVSNASTGTTVKVVNNAGATVDVTVNYDSVTGTSDAATVEVDKFDATSDLTIGDGIETLAIKASGSDSTIAELDHGANATALNLDATGAKLTITESDVGADNTVKTITVTGDSAVTITNDLSTAVTTIDASASTAGVSASLNGLAAKATVTGGSGADTLTAINTNANTINLGAGDDTVDLNAVVASSTGTIAGGDGTDTLVFGDASATLITTNNKAGFTGFETMKAEVSTDTLDFEALSTFVNLELGASTAVTVNNISTAAAGAILVSGDQATSTILNIKDATLVGQDNSMTLTLDHTTKETDIDIADLQSDGLETLNIVSTGAATSGGSVQNSVELGTETNDLTKINISGDSDFALTVQGGANLAGQQTVDASAATGKQAIDLSGDTDGVSITGGSNDDTITSGSGDDILNGGAGNDTIAVTTGRDTIDLGTGNDTVSITLATADAVNANYKIIKNFDVATDSLDLNGTAFSTLGAGGNDDITAGGAAANEFTALTTAGNVTVADPVAVVELSFEFSSGVDLDDLSANSLNGTNLLSALGATSGTTAGTITTAGNDEDLLIIAYQDGDAILYHGNGAGTDTNLVASEINLIGIIEGVEVGALTVADFI